LALGQAQLLLDPEAPEALGHLQNAWDLGFRTEAARAWLVLAKVHSFREAQRAAKSEHDPATIKALLAQARDRYLRPAGHLLAGRGSSDQLRLEHLTRLADLRSRELGNGTDLLQEARAFRAQFPDDVGALLEEAAALEEQANLRWLMARKTNLVWPPPCTSEVEPLRDQAWRLLLEAHRIAPSHPRVYGALADALMIAEEEPTEATPPSAELHARIRDWLKQGLSVAKDDLPLRGQYAFFLMDRSQNKRWRRRLEAEPVVREYMNLLDKGLAASDGRLMGAGLQGLVSCADMFAAHGFQAPGLVRETFEKIRNAPSPRVGAETYRRILANASLTLGCFLFESGGDPRLFLELGETCQTSPTLWVVPFHRDLLRAQAAIARGEAPDRALASANAALDRRRPLQPREARWEPQLRLLQARWLGRSQDWAALEASLAPAEQAAASLGRDADLLPLLDANLALARNVPERANAHLQAARLTLEAARGRRGMPGHILSERRAELLLLEARQAKAPAPLLQEGLREAARALDYEQNWPVEGSSRAPSALRRWLCPPHQGATHLLKGELLLALAGVAGTPASRRRLALEAHRALDRAVTLNANLARSAGPLLAQAGTLASPDRRPSSDPDYPGRPAGTILGRKPLPFKGPYART